MQLTDSLPRLAYVYTLQEMGDFCSVLLLLLHYDESMRAHGLTYSCIAYSVCMYYCWLIEHDLVHVLYFIRSRFSYRSYVFFALP